MIKNVEIGDLQCVCAPREFCGRVVYMIYPLAGGFDSEWLETQARKNNCSIVVVYVPLDKWNDYLTPWPEPGETPKSAAFAGEGADFLKTLVVDVIPQAEEQAGIKDATERDLLGVSLGGLFTLWQWMHSDVFRSIACLSGSFWYAGFMEWFEKQIIPSKAGKAYFLLGKEEPEARIRAYRAVGVNTAAIVAALKKAGIYSSFEWVPGNHFANPRERAEKALGALSGL